MIVLPMKTFIKSLSIRKTFITLSCFFYLAMGVSIAQNLDADGFDPNAQVAAFQKEANSLPVGSIVAMAGEARPVGYILCDGRSLPIISYPQLYAVLKDTYGGNATSFNLPDMRGLFLRGWSANNSSNDPDRGSREGGNSIGSDQGDAFASHNHTMQDAGNHRHTQTRMREDGSGNLKIANDGKDPDASYQTVNTGEAGIHSHTINNRGGNETRPKNVYVAYWIKAKNTVSVDGDMYAGGKLGLGIANPAERLDVDGKVKANGVVLNIGTFPDYVFEDEYELMCLEELEKYIKTNKHLPKMPSEAHVVEHGADLGQINQVLVEKVEELTLYTIRQHKEIRTLYNELKVFKDQLKALLEQ